MRTKKSEGQTGLSPLSERLPQVGPSERIVLGNTFLGKWLPLLAIGAAVVYTVLASYQVGGWGLKRHPMPTPTREPYIRLIDGSKARFALRQLLAQRYMRIAKINLTRHIWGNHWMIWGVLESGDTFMAEVKYTRQRWQLVRLVVRIP